MAPITSKGWTLDGILATGSNLKRATVIDSTSVSLVRSVNECLDAGLPAVVTGYERHDGWDGDLFSLKSIRNDFKKLPAHARNVVNGKNTDKFTFSHILKKSVRQSPFADSDEHVRYYAKDISPPGSWKRWLDPTPGKTTVLADDFLPLGSDDLFAHLPVGAQPESLLCYFGPGDTYTTWYKDFCGSISQNLMCYTAPNASVFWFMVSSSDADKASSYFHERGQELDSDDPAPFSLPQDIKGMPFEVFVCQQKRGDLVILPPRCMHQVIHHGGFSGSMAWSRMTISSLAHALHLELPIYNRIARPETYRVKLTLWYATLHEAKRPSPDQALLEELLDLLDQVLISEWTPAIYDLEPSVIFGEDFMSCDYCAADIFVAYFECEGCGKQREDAVVLCSLCYASGRTCGCVTGMAPCVTAPFRGIVDKRNGCAKVLANLGVRTPQMTDQSITRSSVLKTFESACAIQRRRQETGQSTVTCPFDESHHEAAAATVECDTADGSAFFCFRHLLNTPAAMHSARAAGLSSEDISDAMSTGPCRDDDTGNYLSVVLRKYQTASNAGAEVPTRKGWYDLHNEEASHEDYAKAQECAAARLSDEIRKIVHIVRGTRPSSSADSTQAPVSDDSELSPMRTQPSPSTSATGKSDHLRLTPPSVTDESEPPLQSFMDVDERQLTPVLITPLSFASSSTIPASCAAMPGSEARPAIDVDPPTNGKKKKRPARSRKRSSLVIPSDGESDSSSDEDTPRRPSAKKQAQVQAKRTRVGVHMDTSTPVAKRRKVAELAEVDVSMSCTQTQTASAAERLAQALSQRTCQSTPSSSAAATPATPAAKTPRGPRAQRRIAPASSRSSASTLGPTLRLAAAGTSARPGPGRGLLCDDDDGDYRSSTLVPSTAPSTPARTHIQPGTPNARAQEAHPPAGAATDAMSVECTPDSGAVESSSELNSGVPAAPSTAAQPTTTFIQQPSIIAYSALVPPWPMKPQPQFPNVRKKRSSEDEPSPEMTSPRPQKQIRLDVTAPASAVDDTRGVLVAHGTGDGGQLAGVLTHVFDALVQKLGQDGPRSQMAALHDLYNQLQSRCAYLEAQLCSTQRDLATTRQELDAARQDSAKLMAENAHRAQQRNAVYPGMDAPPPWRANQQSNPSYQYAWQGQVQRHYQDHSRQFPHSNPRSYQQNGHCHPRLFVPRHDGRGPVHPPGVSPRGNSQGATWGPGFDNNARARRDVDTRHVSCSGPQGHAQAGSATTVGLDYQQNRPRRNYKYDARAAVPQPGKQAHDSSPSRGRTMFRTSPRSGERSSPRGIASPRRRGTQSPTHTPLVHSRSSSTPRSTSRSPRHRYYSRSRSCSRPRRRSRSRSPSRLPPWSRSPSPSRARSRDSRRPALRSRSHSRRRRFRSRSSSRSRGRSDGSRSPSIAHTVPLEDQPPEPPSLRDRILPREGSVASVRIGSYIISRQRQDSPLC